MRNRYPGIENIMGCLLLLFKLLKQNINNQYKCSEKLNRYYKKFKYLGT